MMASTVAGNVSTRLTSLSANPSRNPHRSRARALMIASAYGMGRGRWRGIFGETGMRSTASGFGG